MSSFSLLSLFFLSYISFPVTLYFWFTSKELIDSFHCIIKWYFLHYFTFYLLFTSKELIITYSFLPSLSIYKSHPKNFEVIIISSFLHLFPSFLISHSISDLFDSSFSWYYYFLHYWTIYLCFISIMVLISLFHIHSLIYIPQNIHIYFSIPHLVSFTSKEDFIIFIIYYFCWHWMWTNQHSQISFTICTYPNVHVYISL